MNQKFIKDNRNKQRHQKEMKQNLTETRKETERGIKYSHMMIKLQGVLARKQLNEHLVRGN